MNATSPLPPEDDTGASLRKLLTLVSNLPGMVYRFHDDLSRTAEFVSAGATRVTGYRPEDFVSGGVHWGLLVHPDDRALIGAALEEAARGGQAFRLEYRIRHRDGTDRWVCEQGQKVQEADGSPVVLEGYITDVGNDQGAETAMRDSELRYRTLVDATSAVTWSCPPSGLHVKPQPAWMAFTGQSAEEMLGTGWTKAVHPDDVAQAAEHWRLSVERGEPFVSEHRIRRHDGAWRWMSVHAAPIRDSSGQLVEWIGMNLDITERKQAEEERERLLGEVQAERDRISALVASMHDEVWFADAQKRFTLANPAALKEFGLAGSEPVDIERLAASLEVLRPDGSPRPIEESAPLRALRGETVTSQEVIICTPASGEPRYRQVNATPVRDKTGQIIGSVSVVRDITERRRAEEALERARNTLAEAQKIAHLGSFEYVAATRTTLWSEEEFRIYGFDPAGQSPTYDEMLQNCIHPDDAALLHDTFTEAMQSHSVYELEHRIRRPDGSVRWVYDRAHPYFDEQGELVRYVGATLDITERKEAEVALRELALSLEQKVSERTAELEMQIQQRLVAETALRAERDFMDAVLDSQAALVIVLDSRGRVVRFNQACEVTAGYDFALLQHSSSTWEQLVPEEERAGVWKEVLAPLQAGADFIEHENHWNCKDGSQRLIYWRNKPLRDEQGGIRYIIGTGIDVTDLRHAEEAAREHLEEVARLQRLQTANELATVLAHELNQPLAAIATYAEVGRQWLRKPSPEPDKLADNLEKISRQALRAGDIIRNLRSFVSRGRIDPVPMDLSEVVRSACDLMGPETRRRGVRLEMTLDPKVPPVLGVDVQVELVLLNLLRNACDAMRDAGVGGGTVKVETRRVGDKAQVTVSDSGPGIDAEAAAKLFEPLSSRKVHGLGVGLRISRTMMEAHGGRLWVEPHVPGGVFHFELPLDQ